MSTTTFASAQPAVVLPHNYGSDRGFKLPGKEAELLVSPDLSTTLNVHSVHVSKLSLLIFAAAEQLLGPEWKSSLAEYEVGFVGDEDSMTRAEVVHHGCVIGAVRLGVKFHKFARTEAFRVDSVPAHVGEGTPLVALAAVVNCLEESGMVNSVPFRIGRKQRDDAEQTGHTSALLHTTRRAFQLGTFARA